MERSRLTRSTAPESRKSGAPTSRLGPLFSPSGSRVSSSESVGSDFFRKRMRTTLTVMRCNHVEKGRFAAERADLAEQLKESLLIRSSASADPNHPQAQGVHPATMELV